MLDRDGHELLELARIQVRQTRTHPPLPAGARDDAKGVARPGFQALGKLDREPQNRAVLAWPERREDPRPDSKVRVPVMGSLSSAGLPEGSRASLGDGQFLTQTQAQCALTYLPFLVRCAG